MNEDAEIWLELFVQGQSARAAEALTAVRKLCEQHYNERYRLDVVDIYQQPERTRDAGIRATPTLVRRVPGPVLRIVGPLTETRVLQGLGLATAT